MNVHIRSIYEQIKDIECPKCVYKASVRGVMKMHIKSCEYKAAQKGHLEMHIRSVHEKITENKRPKCEYVTGARLKPGRGCA